MKSIFFEEEIQQSLKSSPKPLFEFRDLAFKKYKTIGLPTLKDESWKYTNIKSLVNKPWVPSFEKDKKIEVPIDSENQLTFVDGFFQKDLSSWNQDELKIINAVDCELEESLSQRVEQSIEELGDGFSALNIGMGSALLFIQVKKETLVEEPLVIKHIFSQYDKDISTYCANSVFINLDSNSKLDIVDCLIPTFFASSL